MTIRRVYYSLAVVVMSVGALLFYVQRAPDLTNGNSIHERMTASEVGFSFAKSQWGTLLAKDKPVTNEPFDALYQQACDVAKWLFGKDNTESAMYSVDPIVMTVIVSGEFSDKTVERVSDVRSIKDAHGHLITLFVWCEVPRPGTAPRVKVVGAALVHEKARLEGRVIHACREFVLRGSEWIAVTPEVN